MPPKMGLRMSSYFHNAFYAFDCQGLSGIAGEERPVLAESRQPRTTSIGQKR